MASTSPTPPVAFKDQCSIIHNNTLYVYSPAAFQTLELTHGAQWQQQTNGISVTGAVCVKGGIDGDNSKPALYVVGGVTNSSTTNYTGMQRYSISDKSWTTISPITAVTSQRLYHGAAYLNASSSIVVYAGSQSGSSTPSTETFLMLMYPPYRVQAYSSSAPPTINPFLLPFDANRAVMVGGSATNQGVYMFDPDNGFRDFGLSLPSALPDRSVAQSTLVTLDDNSKILLTFRTDQSPNTVTRNVLMNPGNLPAVYGETAGSPTSSAAATSTSASTHKRKRTTILSTYPAYNSTEASSTTRSNFALAQGSNEFTAIVGGDSSNSVIFFNKMGNSWEAASDILGTQKPLTSSSSTTSPTASPTISSTSSARASATTTGAAGSVKPSNSLAVLGGVLGVICGLAAILIIILIWLRNVRRRKTKESSRKSTSNQPQDKISFEEQGLQPLSKMGQPMGRSPITSAVIDERDSITPFGGTITEKSIEAGGARSHHHHGSNLSFSQNPFKRQQPNSLIISKPMLADLGDYQERPSIELGKATPAVPTIATSPLINSVANEPETSQKADQRKTDEGWAKYFAPGAEAATPANKRDTTITNISGQTTATARSLSRRAGGGGGFWPGSGIREPSPRSPKIMRDSNGRALTAHQVTTNSPNLQAGPTNPQTLTMSTAEGIPGRISSAESLSTNATDDEDDDDYEDERMAAYSSGVPSVHDTAWTPVGNTWSGPPQRPLRPPSSSVGTHEFPPGTSMSNLTDNSENSKSSIPAFPMPASTIRRVQPSREVQPPAAVNPAVKRMSEDYFGPSAIPAASTQHQAASQPRPDNTDISWLKLGSPQAPAELAAYPEKKLVVDTNTQPQPQQ